MTSLFFRFRPLLLIAVLLSSCAPSSSDSRPPALPGRPGPAYIQWLEEQACLRRAPELTGIVSGSMLSWKYASGDSQLPLRARSWFRISPVLTAWSGQTPLTSALTGRNMAGRLAELGISGVVLTGLADTGDDWAGRSPATALGTDGTSLTFGRLAGKDGDYAAWVESLARTGLLAGGELLPADTGMGPDFFLSAMAVRDYPGLYAMTEISPEFWPILPSLKEKETAPLSRQTRDVLTSRGALPPALEQDGMSPDLLPSGWAATGPIKGVDGVRRRWVYRWHGRYDRPVLHWDDPSGAARRVMEASLIQQAGLRHQALVGIRAAAWMGLVTASDSAATSPHTALEPGLSALRDLARNAHRYGSAVFVQDILPPDVLATLMDCGADFFFDSVLSPALERSLLTEDAGPVQKSLRRAMRLGLDQRRLWRGSPDGLPRPDFVPLLPLLPAGWQERLVIRDAPAEGPRMNAPTLAAMACGLAPGERPDAEKISAIRKAHELTLAARMFLPGLFLLSGTDLDGSVPDGRDWHATPPLWQMDRMPASPQGLPSGQAIYSRMPGNDMDSRMKVMLAARDACGIALGTLVSVPSCGSQGVLMTVCTLPQGGLLAFFGNFSRQESVCSPHFPFWDSAAERRDLLSGLSVPAGSMSLRPREWRAVLLH